MIKNLRLNVSKCQLLNSESHFSIQQITFRLPHIFLLALPFFFRM